MTLMETTDRGLALIRKYEGLQLQAYRCPAGIWTIGYGHTSGVTKGMVITRERAEELLKEDVRPCEQLLNKMGVNFRQEQFDALVSWIFNIGSGDFVSSTLCKRIQNGSDDEDIADQIVRWIYAGGKPRLGLKKRRVDEANLFLGKVRYRVSDKGNIIKV